MFAAVLAVVLALAFWYSHHRNSRMASELSEQSASAADAAPVVEVVRVSYSSPSSTLVLPGEARAWYTSTIYARVSGYIDSWSKDIGDKVTKGQTLALIQTPELDDQLRAAEAKVAADKSLVAVADSNEQFAKIQHNRWTTAQPGVVPKQEVDEKDAEYVSSSARLKAARSQVDLDQAEVNRLKDLTNFKNVVAPYDGVITARRIDIGDLVTAGSMSSNTPLYDIVQSDKIRVFVDVPQNASGDIHVAMPAIATAQQFPGQKFSGQVARTSESIDSAAKTLKVEVDIPNSDLALKPGMYLEVSFQTSTAHPPVQVPAAAMNFRTGGPQVAVIDANGIVHFRDVAIARDMGNVVELASGVSAGDMVALNISNQIADGEKVQTNVEEDSSDPQHRSEPKMAMAPQPK